MNDDTELVIAERCAVLDTVEPPAIWERAVALSMDVSTTQRSLRAGWLVTAAVVAIIAMAVSLVAVMGGDGPEQQVETPPAGPSEIVDSRGPEEARVPVADGEPDRDGWLVAVLDEGWQVVVVDLGSGDQLVFDAPRDRDERFENGAVRPNGDVVIWSQQAVYLYEDGGTAPPRLIDERAEGGGLRAAMTPDGSGVWIAHREGPFQAGENSARVRLVDIDTAEVQTELVVDGHVSSFLGVDAGLVLGSIQLEEYAGGLSGATDSARLYLVVGDGHVREIAEAGRLPLAAGRYVLTASGPPPNWYEVFDLHSGTSWMLERRRLKSLPDGALSSAGEVLAVVGESPIDAFGNFPRVVAVSVIDGSMREIWQSDGPGAIRAVWANEGTQIAVVQGDRVLVFDAADPEAGPTMVTRLPQQPGRTQGG